MNTITTTKSEQPYETYFLTPLRFYEPYDHGSCIQAIWSDAHNLKINQLQLCDQR